MQLILKLFNDELYLAVQTVGPPEQRQFSLGLCQLGDHTHDAPLSHGELGPQSSGPGNGCCRGGPAGGSVFNGFLTLARNQMIVATGPGPGPRAGEASAAASGYFALRLSIFLP